MGHTSTRDVVISAQPAPGERTKAQALAGRRIIKARSKSNSRQRREANRLFHETVFWPNAHTGENVTFVVIQVYPLGAPAGWKEGREEEKTVGPMRKEYR